MGPLEASASRTSARGRSNEEVDYRMIATIESLDAILADAVLQAARNNALARDAAEHYLDEISTANRSQFAAFGALQQAVLRTAIDLQTATIQLSRSVEDATSSLNRALIQWAAAAFWPWEPLGMLTEPDPPIRSYMSAYADSSEDPDETEAFASSALQFQGPMSNVASGLGELDLD